MIRVKCPKCTKTLGFDERRSGAVGTCPQCGQKFKLPRRSVPPAPVSPGGKGTGDRRPAKAPPQKAPPQPAARHRREDLEDDLTPYQIQALEDNKPLEDERVDQMVIDAWRQREREKAWAAVGPAAKVMKIFGGIMAVLVIVAFFLVLGDCILYWFKMEQAAANPDNREDYPIPRMFIFSNYPPGEAPAGMILGIATGATIFLLVMYGLIIAGAEKMKKLDSYGLAMTGSIIGIPFLFGMGALGLISILDKKVKRQFPSFKEEREKWEKEYWEGRKEDEEDEEEEYDEDEEEE